MRQKLIYSAVSTLLGNKFQRKYTNASKKKTHKKKANIINYLYKKIWDQTFCSAQIFSRDLK